LQTAGAESLDSGAVAHTPEALEQWAVALGQRFSGRPIAVAFEQSRGALLFGLPNTSTWCCILSTRRALHITERACGLRVLKMIHVMRNSC
jgi:hypothetical protein